MSETLLTKCPHCSTTFRLTKAQLDIAGGAVRCGACYQVFHASEHIVKTSVVEEIRQPVPPKPDPVEEAFELETDEGLDPYDSVELDMDSPDADLFSEDYRKSMDVESSMDEFGYAEAKTSKKKGADESWAEELLKELGEEEPEEEDLVHDDTAGKKKFSGISSANSAFGLEDDDDVKPQPKKKPAGNELSDTFRNLGHFSSDDPFSINEIEADEMNNSEAGDDESWAKAMLDELEEDTTARKQPESLAILSDEPVTQNKGNPFGAKELARSKREAVERAKAEQRLQPKTKKPKPAAPADEEGLRNSETEEFFRLLDEPAQQQGRAQTEPRLSLDELDDLESDINDTAIKPEKLFNNADDIINRQVKLSAMQFGDEEPVRRPWLTAVVTLGTLLLVVVLGVQYVYFNFDAVSRNPVMRPWLALTCAQIGCQLPHQTDVDNIVGTNLVVRSHPHERNALVIDVIIKNKAPFEQPFPVVQLSFEDMDGNPVASRRFQPREYIQDVSIDVQHMPPNTPIHLTLEIVDPGSNAVNYQLQFLPAGTPG